HRAEAGVHAADRSAALSDPRAVDWIPQPAADVPGHGAEIGFHLVAAAAQAAAAPHDHAVEGCLVLAIAVQGAAHADGLVVFDEPVAGPQRIHDLHLQHLAGHVGDRSLFGHRHFPQLAGQAAGEVLLDPAVGNDLVIDVVVF